MSAPSQRGWRPPSATTPGAIAAAQRALHDLNGAAHDAVGRLGRRPGRLRIPVDQHHHVGGAVGQPLRDMQAAAPRAHRPVDRAQLVAGHVPADVGVLDARPDVPGQVGAEPVEQFGARDRGGLRRRQREHEDVGGVDHARAHDKPAARNDARRGPRSDTGPSVSAATATVCRCRDAGSTVSSRMPSTASSVRSAATSPVSAVRPTRQPGLLGLEAARRAGLGVHVNPRHRALPPDRHQDAEQWRRERDQLPVAADHRDGERDRGST